MPGIFKGNEVLGLRPNSVFGTLATEPKHVGLTLNSDTPYAPLPLDLRDGPMVIELPPGPLICVAMDVNQWWVADMGLPGPDQGRGGRHVILPPGYQGDIRGSGAAGWRRRQGGHRAADHGEGPAAEPCGWLDRTHLARPHPRAARHHTGRWEDNIGFWEALHEVIDTEPPLDGYRAAYGELAALGIAKGQPFVPDARMKAILERAARTGNAQMRVQSFSDRRPDRVVWPDRQWEWAALRFENGQFDRPASVDTEAREKWFYQAIGASRPCSAATPGRVAVLARPPRCHRRLPRRRPGLQAQRPAPGPREAVLVGHRLRRP